jgi:hypothetical protein
LLGTVAAVFGGIFAVGNVGGLLFGASYRASDYATGLIICAPIALVGFIASRWSINQCRAFIRQLKGTGCLRCAVLAASAHNLPFKEQNDGNRTIESCR